MKKVIQLIPIEPGTSLLSCALGMQHVFEQRGLNASLFWPVGTEKQAMEKLADVNPVFTPQQFMSDFTKRRMPELLENIVAAFDEQTGEVDVVCVMGAAENNTMVQARQFNISLAKSLDTRVIFVATAHGTEHLTAEGQMSTVLENFSSIRDRVIGVIYNKIGVPVDKVGRDRPDLSASLDKAAVHHITELKTRQSKLPIIGCIPWEKSVSRPRTADLSRIFDVEYISKGDADTRRISWFSVATRTVNNLAKTIKANTLIVTSGDRVDVLMMAALAEMKGIKLAGLLLTAATKPADESLQLIQGALDLGLPVMLSNLNTYEIVSSFPEVYLDLPEDDYARYNDLKNHIANHLDRDILRELVTVEHARRLSPAAFRYGLVKRSRQLDQCIVLPEGDEPRTIQAAQICAERGMARCVLLGEPSAIAHQAHAQDITLHESIQIVNPIDVYERYIAEYVELRKHKGMNHQLASESLQENRILLGTMMLQMGEVDGLVAGAVNTTAATVAPALQVIKTKPGQALVSSCFFMCLPDQVLVYADCAINPDPSAEQLADIAVQSAVSARQFGIDPKVAMISYSTGMSGRGSDVEKVREATKLAKSKIADYPVDGPLQYDAASVEKVAKSKAPDSEVAGKATVFVFPDLNTGNTTYKAVQRSAGVISIGPMLQGLNKPVNDLSRGALVDDIVYTIALTAIQAGAR